MLRGRRYWNCAIGFKKYRAGSRSMPHRLCRSVPARDRFPFRYERLGLSRIYFRESARGMRVAAMLSVLVPGDLSCPAGRKRAGVVSFWTSEDRYGAGNPGIEHLTAKDRMPGAAGWML
jgi:hypothetical protein